MNLEAETAITSSGVGLSAYPLDSTHAGFRQHCCTFAGGGRPAQCLSYFAFCGRAGIHLRCGLGLAQAEPGVHDKRSQRLLCARFERFVRSPVVDVPHFIHFRALAQDRIHRLPLASVRGPCREDAPLLPIAGRRHRIGRASFVVGLGLVLARCVPHPRSPGQAIVRHVGASVLEASTRVYLILLQTLSLSLAHEDGDRKDR